MDIQKLKRLKRKLSQFRGHPANLKSRDLISLAEALGRSRIKGGDEPTYISEFLPHSRPISIPSHSKNLNKFTAGNILDALEQDIFNFEEELGD